MSEALETVDGVVGDARVSSSQIAARIGRTIRRLRTERKLTLQDLAAGANVSASFVGALERGETDIAIGRLERIAAYFNEDLRTILGYSRDEVRFNYVPSEDWDRIAAAEGVDVESCIVPGTSRALSRLSLQPGARYTGPESADGVVNIYVLAGTITVAVADRVFGLHKGDAGSFAATNSHLLVNEGQREATALIMTAANGRER